MAEMTVNVTTFPRETRCVVVRVDRFPVNHKPFAINHFDYRQALRWSAARGW
jgi:hypothetical protein